MNVVRWVCLLGRSWLNDDANAIEVKQRVLGCYPLEVWMRYFTFKRRLCISFLLLPANEKYEIRVGKLKLKIKTSQANRLLPCANSISACADVRGL